MKLTLSCSAALLLLLFLGSTVQALRDDPTETELNDQDEISDEESALEVEKSEGSADEEEEKKRETTWTSAWSSSWESTSDTTTWSWESTSPTTTWSWESSSQPITYTSEWSSSWTSPVYRFASEWHSTFPQRRYGSAREEFDTEVDADDDTERKSENDDDEKASDNFDDETNADYESEENRKAPTMTEWTSSWESTILQPTSWSSAWTSSWEVTSDAQPTSWSSAWTSSWEVTSDAQPTSWSSAWTSSWEVTNDAQPTSWSSAWTSSWEITSERPTSWSSEWTIQENREEGDGGRTREDGGEGRNGRQDQQSADWLQRWEARWTRELKQTYERHLEAGEAWWKRNQVPALNWWIIAYRKQLSGWYSKTSRALDEWKINLRRNGFVWWGKQRMIFQNWWHKQILQATQYQQRALNQGSMWITLIRQRGVQKAASEHAFKWGKIHWQNSYAFRPRYEWQLKWTAWSQLGKVSGRKVSPAEWLKEQNRILRVSVEKMRTTGYNWYIRHRRVGFSWYQGYLYILYQWRDRMGRQLRKWDSRLKKNGWKWYEDHRREIVDYGTKEVSGVERQLREHHELGVRLSGWLKKHNWAWIKREHKRDYDFIQKARGRVVVVEGTRAQKLTSWQSTYARMGFAWRRKYTNMAWRWQIRHTKLGNWWFGKFLSFIQKWRISYDAQIKNWYNTFKSKGFKVSTAGFKRFILDERRKLSTFWKSHVQLGEKYYALMTAKGEIWIKSHNPALWKEEESGKLWWKKYEKGYNQDFRKRWRGRWLGVIKRKTAWYKQQAQAYWDNNYDVNLKWWLTAYRNEMDNWQKHANAIIQSTYKKLGTMNYEQWLAYRHYFITWWGKETFALNRKRIQAFRQNRRWRQLLRQHGLKWVQTHHKASWEHINWGHHPVLTIHDAPPPKIVIPGPNILRPIPGRRRCTCEDEDDKGGHQRHHPRDHRDE